MGLEPDARKDSQDHWFRAEPWLNDVTLIVIPLTCVDCGGEMNVVLAVIEGAG